MSINPFWKITGMEALDKNDKKNVVVIVDYQISATKNGKTFRYSGNVEIQYTDGTFTEFEKLTEMQVIGWVWEALGLGKDKILARMEKELDKQPTSPLPIAQPVSLMPPWVKATL